MAKLQPKESPLIIRWHVFTCVYWFLAAFNYSTVRQPVWSRVQPSIGEACWAEVRWVVQRVTYPRTWTKSKSRLSGTKLCPRWKYVAHWLKNVEHMSCSLLLDSFSERPSQWFYTFKSIQNTTAVSFSTASCSLLSGGLLPINPHRRRATDGDKIPNFPTNIDHVWRGGPPITA